METGLCCTPVSTFARCLLAVELAPGYGTFAQDMVIIVEQAFGSFDPQCCAFVALVMLPGCGQPPVLL
jgi:hypothetical protein